MDKIRNWRVRSGERWQKQTDMQRWTVKILVALAVVAALSVLPSLFAGDWQGFLLNLGTELGGAVVTFILINRIIGGGEERERLKADLIARMRSQVNEVAVQAVEELGRHGWLTDSSLKGANLTFANLKGANLLLANLQGADLRGVNLEGASLTGANLQGADLRWSASLQGAVLVGANLQGADLAGANLQGAVLTGANLQGTDLAGANLQGTDLAGVDLQEADLVGANLQRADLWSANLQGLIQEEANFNEETVLPDGSKWAPDTDMARFTDPAHPDFWHSDDPDSPVYRDDSNQGG